MSIPLFFLNINSSSILDDIINNDFLFSSNSIIRLSIIFLYIIDLKTHRYICERCNLEYIKILINNVDKKTILFYKFKIKTKMKKKMRRDY